MVGTASSPCFSTAASAAAAASRWPWAVKSSSADLNLNVHKHSYNRIYLLSSFRLGSVLNDFMAHGYLAAAERADVQAGGGRSLRAADLPRVRSYRYRDRSLEKDGRFRVPASFRVKPPKWCPDNSKRIVGSGRVGGSERKGASRVSVRIWCEAGGRWRKRGGAAEPRANGKRLHLGGDVIVAGLQQRVLHLPRQNYFNVHGYPARVRHWRTDARL